MNKTVLKYGFMLALVLTLFKVMEYSYFSYKITLETYLGLVALAFLALGVYVGFRFNHKKEKEIIYLPKNSQTEGLRSIEDTGLSEREYELLILLSEGYSNQEIADKLFISLSTVKTHLSNIYIKLDVKRRTQAIQKAKEMNIV